jgi:hypothetical protein
VKRALLLAGAALLLAACTEKPQTAGRKADGKAWEINEKGYMAPGWQGGDSTAWNNQIRARSQGQNEYARASGQP